VVAGGFPVLRLEIGRTLHGRDGVEVVGEAGCARSCEALALQTRADIVVLDTRLSGRFEGIELCRRLKGLPNPPKVVVYSGDNSPRTVTESLSAGADSFVHHSAWPDELVQAVNGVRAARPSWLLGSDQERRGAAGDRPRAAGLTGREQEILTLMLQRRTNGEIAAELCLANQTVKNYVSGILRKLGIPSRKHLFSIAPGER
jgi:DNA-binding NarL/FixJ family response regulator